MFALAVRKGHGVKEYSLANSLSGEQSFSPLMDSDTAFWVLSTITIVTTTITGFLLIALVFFIERNIAEIHDRKKLLGNKPIGLVFVAMFIIGWGLYQSYSAVDTMHSISDSSVRLDEELSGRVDYTLLTFKSYMLTTFMYLAMFIMYCSSGILSFSRELGKKNRNGKAEGEKGVETDPASNQVESESLSP